MFHVKHHADIERIQRMANEVGVEVSQEQAGQLLAHLEIVIEANQTLNLTAISDRAAGIRLHIVDSLAVVPALRESGAQTILDIGSGAGYPGVPIAITNPGRVTLLESRSRRAAFLGELLNQLGIQNAEARCARAEDLASASNGGDFDSLTARAVSALPSLVELAAPLLKHGGELIAMKGPITEDELDRGDRVGGMVGMERVSVHRFLLPESGESRSLVIFRKVAESAIALPRNPGRAQKRPLA